MFDMSIRKAFWNKRRFWLSLGTLAVLFVLLLIGGYAYLHYAGERDLALALAETDQLDPYWRLEDLEAHRQPMPPPGQNGFEQVMAAASVMPAMRNPQPRFPQFDDDQDYHKRVVNAIRKSLEEHDRMAPLLLNEEEARVLRTEIERGKSSIALARQMVDFPAGRHPNKLPARGSGFSSGPFSKMLDVAKQLPPDARVRIFDGDVAGALADVRAVLHISRVLEDEPSMMAHLVRVVIDLFALDILERVMAGGIVSEEELAVLQQELEHEAASTMDDFGFRGNRANLDHLLEAAQSGAISKDELWAEVSLLANGRPGTPLWTRLLENLRFTLMYGNLSSERARTLRAHNEVIRIVQLPPQKRLQALRALNADAPAKSYNTFTWRETYFGDSRMYAKYIEDELGPCATLSCAIAAVAAERFRLAKKRWPQNLEELTPHYLKTVPYDLFTGQPLRLVRKGSAFVIYSVGKNEVDDSGTLAPDLFGRGPDVGFVLHDPDQRRKPKPPFVYPER